MNATCLAKLPGFVGDAKPSDASPLQQQQQNSLYKESQN
jgi:hypothetical protein